MEGYTKCNLGDKGLLSYQKEVTKGTNTGLHVVIEAPEGSKVGVNITDVSTKFGDNIIHLTVKNCSFVEDTLRKGDESPYDCVEYVDVVTSRACNIGSNFMRDCPNIRHITLPKTGLLIGSNFMRNSAMRHYERFEIVIPEGFKVIGDSFSRASQGVTSVVLPSTARILGSNMCDGCMRLKSFVMKDPA